VQRDRGFLDGVLEFQKADNDGTSCHSEVAVPSADVGEVAGDGDVRRRQRRSSWWWYVGYATEQYEGIRICIRVLGREREQNQGRRLHVPEIYVDERRRRTPAREKNGSLAA
jgi:hypothetical protein